MRAIDGAEITRRVRIRRLRRYARPAGAFLLLSFLVLAFAFLGGLS